MSMDQCQYVFCNGFLFFPYPIGILIQVIFFLFQHYILNMSEVVGQITLVYGFPDCERSYLAMTEMTKYHLVFMDFELNAVARWHFGVMSQRDGVSTWKGMHICGKNSYLP